MSRTLTAFLGLLCCLVVVSACSGSEASEASDSPTPSSPSAVSSDPTTATSPPTQEPPEAQPPKLPPLAREKSPAGAKAFVEYYMEALNYSWHAGSGRLARQYSTPDCIACRGIARSIDEMDEADGFYRGGEWAAASPVLIPSQPLKEAIVHTALRQAAGEWKKSASDHLRRIPSSRDYLDVHLVRIANSWKVTSMVFA